MQRITQIGEGDGEEVVVVEVHAVAKLAAVECAAFELCAEVRRKHLDIGVDAVGDSRIIETENRVGDREVDRCLPVLGDGCIRSAGNTDSEGEGEQQGFEFHDGCSSFILLIK